MQKDDVIYRQAAIDAINHICPVDTEYDCTLLDRVDVRYVLSDLPSAEPARHGKWIQDESGDYKCSKCGGREDQFIYGTENWCGNGESNYCPNCGARMDEE